MLPTSNRTTLRIFRQDKRIQDSIFFSINLLDQNKFRPCGTLDEGRFLKPGVETPGYLYFAPLWLLLLQPYFQDKIAKSHFLR